MRIAAELHDGPVQHLTALDYRLESAAVQLGRNPADASSIIKRAQESLRKQVGELRTMMTQLRPPALDELGLEAALADHMYAVQAASGIRCTLQDAQHIRRLDAVTETGSIASRRKPSPDIVRHSGATEVSVALPRPPGYRPSSRIRDSGVGFGVSDASELVSKELFRPSGDARARADARRPVGCQPAAPGRHAHPSDRPRDRGGGGMSDALTTLETVTPGPRVLVADDEPELRDALIDMLEALEFEVIGRDADGAEAIDMAKELRPDVILMDLRMPNIDGIEATRQIKAFLPRTQVVILTAYSDPFSGGSRRSGRVLLPAEGLFARARHQRRERCRLGTPRAGDPGPQELTLEMAVEIAPRRSSYRYPTITARSAEKGEVMADFVLLYTGGGMPESEEEGAKVMKAWTDWYGTIGASLKDGGNPFGAAKTVSGDGSVKDGATGAQLTGFTILSSASLEAATDIAKGAPVLQNGGSVAVYEVVEM